MRECLCDPGDIVLLEDPTYFVFLGITQSRGLRCRGVKMEEDGIDLKRLEAILEELKRAGDLSRVKMFYSVSYFQNPSGVTTSLEKKQKTLELLGRYERAAGHPIYYLEDAAYRELGFSKEQGVPSALSFKRYSSRVIYAGTYSKPYATGARVGFGLLPEPLCACVLKAKGNHDFGTANLLQKLVCQSIKQGDYAAHLDTLRVRYQYKAKGMLDACGNIFPRRSGGLTRGEGCIFGSNCRAPYPRGPKGKFFKAALAHDVLYVPGELCYADDAARRKPGNEMRLSFGGATESNIRKGIARLGQTITEFLG